MICTLIQPVIKAFFGIAKVEISAQTDMVDPFTKLTVGLGYGRVVNRYAYGKNNSCCSGVAGAMTINGICVSINVSRCR